MNFAVGYIAQNKFIPLLLKKDILSVVLYNAGIRYMNGLHFLFAAVKEVNGKSVEYSKVTLF